MPGLFMISIARLLPDFVHKLHSNNREVKCDTVPSGRARNQRVIEPFFTKVN